MNAKIEKPILWGSLAVALAALLWSLDGTFLRPQLYSLPSVLVVFLEHLLGFFVLFPFLIIYRKQIKNITKKQWLAVFWVALFGGALGTTFITKALFLTGFHDISVVILLQKFQPIFAIVLAAIFLRERFPKNFYIYTAIALVAGYFMTFKNPWTIGNLANAVSGVIVYALLAAFAWGSATAFGKYSIKNISYGLLASLRFGLTVLIMLIPAIRYFNGLGDINGIQWKTLIIIVFSSGAAAMFIYYYGLKKISASLATLCELSWPISAVLLDYIINKNILSWTQIIGALIVIGAITKIMLNNRSYHLNGKVIAGLGQGEKTGLHTANLELSVATKTKMPKGLYTCALEIESKPYSGLLYYGYNSLTKKDCLEAHILNFSGDIYGQTILIITERYLRLPKKFASIEELTKQMKKDLKLMEN
ncbi:MAG: EamA family transporter [Candidatus Magasanikbacteria bacterium CG10_big_fil_rev_8_21_14_0_10_40_10]|uniref:riboflavin kinase n=1 Tax=Candidatus Magasanikbacteria bacterium CG10_big_fil_rev_8_21_14_0_10_40_10 TaxID=1974648 RepID=A0A2M6W3P6_9BACT|nr:MAG: EamA family transporter [Candidatus Magasanikbacteria bacterium CG10_big_fil_rev_8_21_14_0_10_40_10]